jgi:phosphatidylserine/phosphatidylglycerophosphate/cardiolipin synthase-like enzyme
MPRAEKANPGLPLRRRLLLGLVLLTLLQGGCGGLEIIDWIQGGPPVVEETVSGDWIRVYFTRPRYPDDPATRTGGLEEQFVALLAHAQSQIDLAVYDFDLQYVAQALVDAHRRGVRVRLFVEGDNADEEALQTLAWAGATVVADERQSGLMHNKFAVIDGQWVWTGSWNMTENGTYRNNNNAVLIASTALAENYTVEFEELLAGAVGPTSPANTPYPQVEIVVQPEEGAERTIYVENYFAPEDEVAQKILAALEDAQSRIRFMAFTFTSDWIADAMIERAADGVIVQGVIESRNAEREYSEYEHLKRAVHDVLPDGNPYIMHHKVIIIDDATVILGSFNFTVSADESNDENVLIIHDPEVAALFVAEFGRVYEQARTAP